MNISTVKNMILTPAVPIDNDISTVKLDYVNDVDFPTDFRLFIESYGSGRLFDFLVVFNPGSSDENLNFYKQLQYIDEDFIYLKQDAPDLYEFTISISSGGVVPFGVTDNGDYIFWLINDIGCPDEWTIAILPCREQELEYLNLSFSDFIYMISDNRLSPKSFPKLDVSNRNRFDPMA
ncbi:SMI1/KNR4 family protein [Cobetia marina]|uniref:SMI1/KNR4 family protein n=1 Tax=Cobetia marina TaxID=28258 RepID=A0ABU9GKK5_COBMA